MYNDALSAKKADRIIKLEAFKGRNTIYSSLAQLQLAALYVDKGDFTKAIYYYEQLIKNRNVEVFHLDYAKLMLIRTKVAANVANNKNAIGLFDEYLKNSIYFKDVARLEKAALLISEGDKDRAKAEINFIITDTKAPSLLINLARIIQRRAATQ